MLHQAAIPSVPRSVEDPVTSNRANIDGLAQPAGGGARRQGEARRLRRVVVGLRQHAERCRSVETCRPDAALALRAAEAGGGAVPASCSPALYGLETVTIRYFNVFGPRQDPVVALLRRHLALHHARFCDGAAAEDLRRRRAHARLHLRGQRRGRGVLARVRRPEGQRAGDQRRHRRPHLAEPVLFRTMRDDRRRHRSSRSTPRPRAGDVKRLAGRHRQGQGAPRLRADRDRSRTASRRTVDWYRTSAPGLTPADRCATCSADYFAGASSIVAGSDTLKPSLAITRTRRGARSDLLVGQRQLADRETRGHGLPRVVPRQPAARGR